MLIFRMMSDVDNGTHETLSIWERNKQAPIDD